MPSRCAVYDCSNTPDAANQIALHPIPYYGDSRSEAVRRRQRWIAFVKRRRAGWEPTKDSRVCSKHFKPEDFVRILNLPGLEERTFPRLKRDDIGICVYPSIQTLVEEKEPSARDARAKRRKVMKGECSYSEPSTSSAHGMPGEISGAIFSEAEETSAGQTIGEVQEIVHKRTEPQQRIDALTQTIPRQCEQCLKYQNEIRILRNKLISNKQLLSERKATVAQLKSQIDTKEQSSAVKEGDTRFSEAEAPTDNKLQVASSDDIVEEPASDFLTSDASLDTETESSSSGTDTSRPQRKDIRSEPKYIVFLSQLLLLFQFCRTCKSDQVLVETHENGTMVTVEVHCGNPGCREKEFVWQSQPKIDGLRTGAGNLLLSFAILMAGASASKVLRVLSHMGVACFSLRQFFRHQKDKLFPCISHFWKKHQENLMKETIKKNEVVVAGDGRHDSMGHSAKYCAYTLFNCTTPNIIHFSLVQRNEAGSSQGMEYLAFQHSMARLKQEQIKLDSLVTDRHSSITKHMRENEKSVKHYFDLWHLRKKVRKVLTKIGKESNCQEINPWIRACENHLSWSAISTSSGDGKVIIAKFCSFLSHIVNKHVNLDNPLFNKCIHGEIEQRQWLDEKSVVYEKVRKVLLNERLVKGIKQASPLQQTSCLEGFHSVLNHFAPKMIGFSYPGMFIRHIIAILHFNRNLQRETRKKISDGTEQIAVIYPKFKNGEATVRDVKVQADFSYVQEVWEAMFTTLTDEQLLQKERKDIKDMTPKPMNTMLIKQSRDEAVKKREERKMMVTKDVPPTAVPCDEPVITQGQRAKPCCKECHQPMKGHKNVLDCPRNKRN